ncbi:MAG TPA: hypothetical protein VFM60_00525, partial [Salinimicrobium sp.]|nr:hypothetical protein [Salinimicrobium sp.]
SLIQKYTSLDGIAYKKAEDIYSTLSGSSALRVAGPDKLYAAVRSSGISPSSFHFRDLKNKRMWTLELPEVNGAEPRGLGVSPDGKTLIFAAWDKGGGFYKYELSD